MTQENKQSQGQTQQALTEAKHKLYINGMDNLHQDHKAILESALPFFVGRLTNTTFDSKNQELYNLAFELGVNIHALTLLPQERTDFLNTYGANDALFTKHYLKAVGEAEGTGETLENDSIMVGILDQSVEHDTSKAIEEAELQMHSLVLVSAQKIVPTHLIYTLFETRKIKLNPKGSLIILIHDEVEQATYLERNTIPQLEEMIRKLEESIVPTDNNNPQLDTLQ